MKWVRRGVASAISAVALSPLLVMGGSFSTASASSSGPRSEVAATSGAVRLLAMTFNPDERGDADGIAKVIYNAVGRGRGVAGVAGLQELCKDERSNVMNELRQRSGKIWHSVYQVNDKGGDRPSWVCDNGNAIVSTQSVMESSLVPFRTQHPDERNNNKETRGYVRAKVQVGGVTIHVYSTHLTAKPGRDRQAVRKAQLEQLVADIKQEQFNGPRVILGDLNATPNAPELAALRGLFHNVGPSTPTTSKHIGPCPPQGDGQAKIDHIFVSKSIQVVHSYVASFPDSDNPSDSHCPVISELRIPRR